MMLSGLEIITRKLVLNLRNVAVQQQPCGVDLTLRQISTWTSPATLDFSNTKRSAARTSILPFASHPINSSSSPKPTPDRSNKSSSPSPKSIHLPPGAYLVDFHETIRVPKDLVAFIHPRSSLWRSGVSVSAGVIDSGYEGAIGGLLDVTNPKGVVMFEGARVAQVVFEGMEGDDVGEGYSGVYQGSVGVAGVDGRVEGRE